MKNFHCLLVPAVLLLARMAVCAAPAPADLPPPTVTGSTINGEKVPAAYVQKLYDGLVNLYKTAGRPLPNSLLNKLYSIAHQQAEEQTIMRQYIQQNKIALSPDATKKEMDRLKDDIAGEGMPFEAFLKMHVMSEDELAQEVAVRVAFKQSFKDTLEMDKLKASFETEKAIIPVRRCARMIFMHSRSNESKHRERSPEDAKQQAEAALQAVRNGQDFFAVAKEQGDERDILNAGWFKFDAKKQAFSEALFGLEKVGSVSDVIDTPDGYQILRLTGLRDDNGVWEFFLSAALDHKAHTVTEELIKKAKIEEEK